MPPSIPEEEEGGEGSHWAAHRLAGAPGKTKAGQRPTVIIRGAEPDLVGVTNCYLIVFKEIVFSGGGVQYQQTAECPGCGTGYFDFFQVES